MIQLRDINVLIFLLFGNALRDKSARTRASRNAAEINRAGTIRRLLDVYRHLSSNAASRGYARNFLRSRCRFLPRTRCFFARSITYAPAVIAQCDCKHIYRPGSSECSSGTDVRIFAGISVKGFRIIRFVAGDLGVPHNTG